MAERPPEVTDDVPRRPELPARIVDDLWQRRLPAPDYLPARVKALLPWADAYARRVAAAHQLPLHDVWDEALTALLRADLHADPGPCTHYAHTSVQRGLFRYCLRGRPDPHTTLRCALDPNDPALASTLTPETVLIALEDAGHTELRERTRDAHPSRQTG